MNKTTKETHLNQRLDCLLNDYALNEMIDSRDSEVRLTFFLLSLMKKQSTSRFWIYREELLSGMEIYPTESKRKAYTSGTGIPEYELDRAIKDINIRGLMGVIPDSANDIYEVYLLTKDAQ